MTIVIQKVVMSDDYYDVIFTYFWVIRRISITFTGVFLKRSNAFLARFMLFDTNGLIHCTNMAVSMLSNSNEKRMRNYFVWKCECKDKTMRPRGRAIQEGCGKWNTVSSKHRMGEAEIMPRCRSCKRKKRLTPNNTDVYRFDNREDAIEHEARLNGGVW